MIINNTFPCLSFPVSALLPFFAMSYNFFAVVLFSIITILGTTQAIEIFWSQTDTHCKVYDGANPNDNTNWVYQGELAGDAAFDPKFMHYNAIYSVKDEEQAFYLSTDIWVPMKYGTTVTVEMKKYNNDNMLDQQFRVDLIGTSGVLRSYWIMPRETCRIEADYDASKITGVNAYARIW